MKKGIIYKLIYGKGHTEDFNSEKLPSNRAKQFFVILRTRFGLLFRANLLCAPFFIPLMVWDLLSGWFVGEFVADLTVSEHFSHLINLSLLQYGVDALFMALAFVGLAGLFYVTRRIFWGQPVKIISDFFKGVKDSYKQFFFLGLILGLFLGLMQYLISFASLTMTEDNSLIWSISVCFCVVAAVLAVMISMIACGQASLYKVGFGKLLVNSAVLTFKKLLTSFSVFFLSVGPLIICWFLPWLLARIIACLVLFTAGLCWAIAMQTAFCLSVFDRYINKISYPDFVALGLKDGKNAIEAEGSLTEDGRANNVEDESENCGEVLEEDVLPEQEGNDSSVIEQKEESLELPEDGEENL